MSDTEQQGCTIPRPTIRMRRLRGSRALRSLVRDTHVTVSDLVMPLFVKAGDPGYKQAIATMPGQFQWGIDAVVDAARMVHQAGIPAIILFGIPEHKDSRAALSCEDRSVVQMAVRAIKRALPDLLVMVDVCCCEYTDHGHCGVLTDPLSQEIVDNDATLTVLCAQALSLARAGADVIAPSGMMDGMVAALRYVLDGNGFTHLPILSYAVKYASGFYGPFRDAAEGAPQFSDRKSYQMDYANVDEAVREVALDINEGADMVMVKPAHTYLDVIHRIKSTYPAVPVAAYHVSGEYAMIKAAAAKGWLEEKQAVLEVTTAMKRAGANILISYFGLELAAWL